MEHILNDIENQYEKSQETKKIIKEGKCIRQEVIDFFKKAKKSHIYVTGFLVGEKQNNAT